MVKEAKPAWLAVLQGLKGTAKAQSKMKQLANLWGSGSRVLPATEKSPYLEALLPARRTGVTLRSRQMLHDLREMMRGGPPMADRTPKGEWLHPVHDEVSNKLLPQFVRRKSYAGASWSDHDYLDYAQLPKQPVGVPISPTRPTSPVLFPIGSPQALRIAREGAGQSIPHSNSYHNYVSLGTHTGWGRYMPHSVRNADALRAAIVPHEFSHLLATNVSPTRFQHMGRSALHSLNAYNKGVGIRPATFWDDIYHQSKTTAMHSPMEARLLPNVRLNEMLAQEVASNPRWNPVPNTMPALRAGQAADFIRASLAYSSRGNRLVGLERMYGQVNPYKKFWRGAAIQDHQQNMYGVPYVNNVRYLP